MGKVNVSDTFQVSDVQELLTLMEAGGIGELHLTVKDASIDLVRAAPVAVVQSAPTPAAAVTVATAPCEPEPIVITAPVVGVFHALTRGFPNGGPQPGDAVQAGQVIGSIEIMHLPTDITTPVSGIIDGIMVEDGGGVEYGQALMIIQPTAEGTDYAAGNTTAR